MKKQTSLFFILTGLFGMFHLHAQTIEPPRLVIGIVIDGFQQKHIDLLWNYLNPGGFKQIIEKGVNCKNVNYNIVSAGNAADIANIMTGTTPYYNGIAGNNYYGRKEYEVIKIIQDENQVGIGTKETYSAHHLTSSTIADELVMANPNKSKVYAVAINPEDAIMLGGHTAKNVAWIDDVANKWVTTGYYTNGLSEWADRMNTTGEFRNFVDRSWTPLFAINTYLNLPAKEDKKNGFQYYPSSRKNKSSNSTILKNTPWANTLVAELGAKIITEENLGTDNTPDMVLFQFTVKSPAEKTSALQSAEKEDLYYRLDRDIESLLRRIDIKVGLDKTLVFVVANQTDLHSPTQLGDNKIPSGYFNAHRSMALLSNYLVALYGPERWVDSYYGKNIYLNRQRIEAKKININDIQNTVAKFMLEFEGIQASYTSSQILNVTGNGNSEIVKIQNSTNKKNAGDVIFTLQPGWIEVDDKNNAVGESNAIKSTTPLYFYGWQIEHKTIEDNYQTIDIAPTLAQIMGISTPNASIGKPIKDLLKKQE